MTTLEEALRRVIANLESLHARFALIGGLAVSTRTEPRFTRDVDLVVAVRGDREAELLVAALLGLGYRVLQQLEQDAVGRLATVRLLPPGSATEGLTVDLLFASSGIEPEIVERAEPIELITGLVVPVARLEHLIALKVLARDDRTRPHDRADLIALVRCASPRALDESREAVRLIAQRGFARGKDLERELADCIAQRD